MRAEGTEPGGITIVFFGDGIESRIADGNDVEAVRRAA